MKHIKKRKAMTLLEIMIVIFIIGIIGSVVGYNMRGSLEEGKAFKSEQGSKQVYDILTLEMAKGVPLEKVLENPFETIKNSGLAKNAEKLLTDGWGETYELDAAPGDDLYVVSGKFLAYLTQKGRSFDDLKQQYPWMANEENVAVRKLIERGL